MSGQHNGNNLVRPERPSLTPPSVMRVLMKINRRHPHLSRFCTNLSLITCFAICLCASSYMFNLVDEIIDESFSDIFKKMRDADGVAVNYSRPDVSELKAILEQRGIPIDTLLERNDLDAAVKSTGSITVNELAAVMSNKRKMNQLNISTSADAYTFQNLVNDKHLTQQNVRIDPSKPYSIVFDSESEFIERVEDNKDSVWLLAVVSPKARLDEQTPQDSHSVLTDEVWATLVHRYITFGFKVGLLNCQKLHGICIDRGFKAADLILALPRSGDRMKDLVQFRPYPKHSDSNKLSTKHIAENIHVWVVSVLSERLRSLRTVDEILPASLSFITGANQLRHLVPHWSWLSKRAQPINVLWLPQGLISNELLLRKSSLILSALSVPYTGRARFWVVHPSLLQKQAEEKPDASKSKWAISDSAVHTIPDLLDYLKCPRDSRFLILTPEAKCYSFGSHQGEFFSYDTLELCLRFLFPSANDFFCISFFVLNILLLFSSAFLIAQTMLILIHNQNESLILQSQMNRSTRFGLANTVIRIVRRGWTSHVPNFWRNPFHSSTDDLGSDQFLSRIVDTHTSGSRPVSKIAFVGNKLAECFKTLLIDLASANLLLLLMILPLINLLSLNLSIPFVNLFLWFMRSLTMTQPVVSVRLAISSGHMTLTRLLSVTFLGWLGLVISLMYIYSVVYGTDKLLTRYTYNRRSRRNRLNPSVILERLNQSSPDQFWNELASFLLMSDRENKSDLTSATTSSTAESDTTTGFTIQTKECRVQSYGKSPLINSTSPLILDGTQSNNPELVEGSRLLRRLCRLHRVLCRQTDQLACVPPPPPPPPVSTLPSTFNAFEQYQNFDEMGLQSSRAATTTAAHMYTWQCSLSSKCPPNSKPWVRTNGSDRNRMNRARLSRSKRSEKNQPITDLCYEAEDERDASSDEDLFHQCLTRTVTSDRQNKGQQNMLDLSSDEGCQDTDTEYPLNRNNEISNSSEADLSTFGNQLGWPTWVVPCDACVVCWRKFRSGVRLSALPCGHGFHEVCIRRWLDTGALDCPVCRWPAYAPHLRQQCQMIGQLIEAVKAALNPIRDNYQYVFSNTDTPSNEQLAH